MALFVVLALDNSASVIEASIAKEFPEDYYKIEPGKWFVKAQLVTAKQVSDRIGITNDQNADGFTGVVLGVRGYFGRAPQDMWEWIAAKSVKSDA